MTKMAAVQMCSTDNIDENLQQAGHYIKMAAEQQAKLIAFPEMFALMSTDSHAKVDVKETWGSGKIQNFLAQQAKHYGIWIVGGTIPIADKNPDKVKAACLVYDDQGNNIARYDKIHLFDADVDRKYRESATTAAGDHICVVDTPFGKIGLAVCYDIRFPELFKLLTVQGAQIIILPAAYTVPTGQAHWHVLTRGTAIQNLSYLIAPSQGGRHHGNRTTYGHTLIVDPYGKIMVEKHDDEPGIVYADIDLIKQNEIRQSLPVLKHRKSLKDYPINKFKDSPYATI